MLAHVDHGKSALSDSLISANGIISARSAGKIRYMDSREDEQRRGITMKSSSIALGHRTASTYHPHPLRVSASIAPHIPDKLIHFFAVEDSPLNVVNLIDSPGHVDFTGEVEAALAICDGAILVVDVVEGVCVQTVTVLTAALEHALRPILVLNKIDRLFAELHLDSFEAYQHIMNIIAQVNVIMGVRQVEQMMAAASLADTETNPDWRLDDATSHADDTTVSGYFSPELGNVIFASAIDGWAFRIIDFARLFSNKFGISEKVLNKTLWGNYFFQQKTKRIVKRKSVGLNSKGKPMFVQFIMSNIHAIYDSILSSQHDHDLAIEKRENFVSKLGLKVTSRDIKHRDASTALKAIMNAWLPAARCLIDTVIEKLPSAAAAQAQRERLASLWPNLDRLPLEEKGNESKDKSDALGTSIQLQHDAIAKCDPEGPVIGYVVKMVEGNPENGTNGINIRMPKGRSELQALKEEPGSQEPEQAGDIDLPIPMIAFARILSGRLTVGDSVFVYSPKYEVRQDGSFNESSVSKATVKGLFLLMGRGMDPITSVSAGAVVGIAGLDESVLKTATISTLPPGKCLPAGKTSSASLGLEREAVVRVAVEPHLPGDVGKLQAGLRRLNQADPAVETFITAKGEHVIAAHGELHLERCLKDLRERFAKEIKIHVSKPIVSFRETVCGGTSSNLPIPEIEGKGTETAPAKLPSSTSPGDQRIDDAVSGLRTQINPGTHGYIGSPWTAQIEADSEPHEYTTATHVQHGRFVKVGNELISFRVTAVPLPPPVASALDNASSMLRLSGTKETSTSSILEKTSAEIERALDEYASEVSSRKQTSEDVKTFWKTNLFPRIWSSGPRGFGANVLIGPYRSSTESPIMKKIFGDVKKSVREGTRTARELEKAIITGFQMGTRAGPLCEEPLHGVAILVDKIQLSDADIVSNDTDSIRAEDLSAVDEDISEDAEEGYPIGGRSISGLVIGFMKEAVRQSCLHGNARLMEGMLHADITVPNNSLGKTYTVIGQRRGRVLNEDMKEGMNVFGIEALLPVQDSFGFTEVLRKQTSGFAVPQMTFSHWETIDIDPFWFPRTDEELEDLGASDTTTESNNLARKLINNVRRRKGLRVEEKIVENAEKQRTLSRKK